MYTNYKDDLPITRELLGNTIGVLKDQVELLRALKAVISNERIQGAGIVTHLEKKLIYKVFSENGTKIFPTSDSTSKFLILCLVREPGRQA